MGPALDRRVEKAPRRWRAPATGVECRLHQLSPYIGKLKSTIAAELVESYSRPGDLVADPFCGSGTVPLECAARGRRVVASDSSEYAVLLTKAKLSAPPSVSEAIRLIETRLNAAKKDDVDLRSVPAWVRQFFHPRTLKEAISFANACTRESDCFLFACLLGILHHQRPGFLSYPSSHLVPYLRDKLYPRAEYPDLYGYRDLRSRMVKKVSRVLKNEMTDWALAAGESTVLQRPVEKLSLQCGLDAIITSPPYMNALDYRRDNRLRLWFLDRNVTNYSPEPTDCKSAFDETISGLARNVVSFLKPGGVCVMVVGDTISRKRIKTHPADRAIEILTGFDRKLLVERVIEDRIPDVRRSRRGAQAMKKELVVVLRKSVK